MAIIEDIKNGKFFSFLRRPAVQKNLPDYVPAPVGNVLMDNGVSGYDQEALFDLMSRGYEKTRLEEILVLTVGKELPFAHGLFLKGDFFGIGPLVSRTNWNGAGEIRETVPKYGLFQVRHWRRSMERTVSPGGDIFVTGPFTHERAFNIAKNLNAIPGVTKIGDGLELCLTLRELTGYDNR